MLNILINNIRFVNPTSLIRALKMIKTIPIKIYGTDIEDIGYNSSSLFVDHYIQSPSVDNENVYLSFMKKICIDKQINLIIPGSDKDVQFFAKYSSLLDPIIVLPEDKAIKTFYNKFLATQAIQELGIYTPPVINNFFTEKKIIFRKKISSSSRGIHIINLEEEKNIPNYFNDEYFAQKYIDGQEYTVDVFADSTGTPQIIIPRKRLKIRNGMSVCCQLHKQDKIIQCCQKIYQNFYLPGITNVQFIDDGQQVYFIELNMRFAGSGICGISGSFNYLEHYLKHFVNKEPLKKYNYYMDKVAWDSIISRYYCEYNYSEQKSDSIS